VTEHVDAKYFEPIAGIEVVVHSLQALGKESGNALRFAQRLGGACRNAENPAIDAKENEFEDTASGAAGFERGLQGGGDLAGELRISSSAPTGSIRRRSAERLAIGRRGDIGSSSVPSA
jgi:hypothetical protein